MKVSMVPAVVAKEYRDLLETRRSGREQIESTLLQVRYDEEIVKMERNVLEKIKAQAVEETRYLEIWDDASGHGW